MLARPRRGAESRSSWPCSSSRGCRARYGPGWLAQDADKLAKVALAWLEKEEADNRRVQDTDPRRQIAVVFTGPWSVQETNILGQPVMQGLPVLAACELDREKGDNLARVYVLTLRTVEQAGVKPEPPFDSAAVGDSWYVRRDKVKGR